MDLEKKFNQEKIERIISNGKDSDFIEHSRQWIYKSMKQKYVYNFNWFGRPIIQFPQDMIAMQELIWKVKPDLIIETGIAHGGSLVFSASMLAQQDMADALEAGVSFDPSVSKRKVLGIDIDIREHNRVAIESHPMSSRIQMIEGSSIATKVIQQVKDIAIDYQTIMIFFDSNHTHKHVLAELEAYAPMTSINSYCVVFDTFVEDMPSDLFPDRPWDVGDNPKTAVQEYLKNHSEFEVDKNIEHKLLITVAPDGFLKRVS